MKKSKDTNSHHSAPRKKPYRSANSRFKTILMKVQTALLFALIPSLFFSYHPLIAIGATDSMNLELSLPLIILALFALLSLPTLPQNLYRFSTLFGSRNKTILVFALIFSFPLYLAASVFWSANTLRAVLTTGVAWCIILTILTIPSLMTSHKIKHKLVKVFLYSSLMIAASCWFQCILDLAGLDRQTTLLCAGCTYHSFGFPHPNGFAIEPQFMGNLLLAPVFLSIYLLFRNPTHRRRHLIICFFLITTLFLTFSRGAIYAFLLASCVLVITRLIQTHSRHSLLLVVLIFMSFLASLCTQGIMAQLSPTNDTFALGISKSLDQLSLGHIHLMEADNQTLDEDVNNAQNTTTQEETAKKTKVEVEDGEASYFSGYVEESTTTRLSLTSLALDCWDNNPASLLFGTGIGSAGTTLARTFPDINSSKQIIQNQYASILLELGLLGVILLVAGLVAAIKKLPTPHIIPRIYLIALSLAYIATLFFFSGLPNALHIYLLPVTAYYLILTSPSKRAIQKQH